MKLGFPLANQLIKPHTCYKAGRHSGDMNAADFPIRERSLIINFFRRQYPVAIFEQVLREGVLYSVQYCILCIASMHRFSTIRVGDFDNILQCFIGRDLSINLH